MKKILAILLVMVLSLSLCACPALEDTSSGIKEVHITAGKIEPGMTAKDILVEVTIDNEPVPCRVTLTGFVWDGYWDMEDDEPVGDPVCVRLNVYYSLPEGYDVDQINVTMECDGGEYDGTGSISYDDDGNVEAWSHALYGEDPEAPALHPVNIQVLEFAPGMTVEQIRVAVTVNEQPVEARIGATVHSSEGMRDLEPTDIIPENAIVRLNVYYYLDHGITLDDIEVTMDFPGGTYDGTGSIADHEDGRVEAWSHALYGEIAETEPTTTPETEPATEPSTPVATQHAHSFIEQPGPSHIDCTLDRVKTFKCSCGETKTETVPAPGHDLRDWHETPATCTTDGQKTSSCKRCGAGFIIDILATGHTWSEWLHKTGRVHSHTCSVCGAEEEAPHNIPEGEVTCTDCGADIIN